MRRFLLCGMIIFARLVLSTGMKMFTNTPKTGLSVALLLTVATAGCIESGFEVRRVAKEQPPAPKAERSVQTDHESVEAEPFWWGISTSSYQTEDPGPSSADDFRTDWDIHFDQGHLPDARGNGAWSYSCVDRDIAALKALGATHYRFSIEWARVEPEPGRFNDAAIDHYVNLAAKLRAANITPVVTLWHFTFPAWLASDDADQHGWLHPDAAEQWTAYIRRVAAPLSEHVRTFAPLNEPNAYAIASLINMFPPGGRLSYRRYLRILDEEVKRFKEAAQIVREARPDARIISVQSIIHWKRDPFDLFGFWYEKALEYNYYHLDQIADTCEWIGFNYYQREVASPLALGLQSMRSGDDVSDMGWIIDPKGLEAEIAALAKRYGKPLVITENGVADADDTKRPVYLLDHVLAVRRAREAGYDVRGYFHWSLMDNFEWADGYEMKFGLFAVDRADRALVPKHSASVFRSLADDSTYNEPLRRIAPQQSVPDGHFNTSRRRSSFNSADVNSGASF